MEVVEDNEKGRPSLWQIFSIFFKIGAYAFGGFMALVAVVEHELCDRKKYLDNNAIVDGITLASILPGPLAVNVCSYVGFQLRGVKGAIAASSGVLLPSLVLIIGLGALIEKYGQLAFFNQILTAIISGVVAVIFSVVIRLSKKNVKDKWGWSLAIVAVVVMLAAPKSYKIYVTFLIIFVSGFVGWLRLKSQNFSTESKFTGLVFTKGGAAFLLFMLAILLLNYLPLGLNENGLLKMNLTFSSVSVMMFGGGYVFIPMLNDLVVNQHQWITQDLFVTSIAAGQITPGPIVISVPFIAYKLHGVVGAITSTVAIFGPPIGLILIGAQNLQQLNKSPKIRFVMQHIKAAVVGMIFFAGISIFISDFEMTDWVLTVKRTTLLIVAFVLLERFKLSLMILLPSCGLLGLLLF